MNRRIFLYGATSAAAIAAGAGISLWRRRPAPAAAAAGPQAGAAAASAATALAGGPSAERAALDDLWNLSFATPDGSSVSMASYRGSNLVINFWATWCAPCVREMPQVDRFATANAARGWRVVGLAADEAPKVQEFLRKTPVSYPVAIAGYAGIELSRQLGNTAGGLPFTVAIGRDGRVAHRKLGETSLDELTQWVNS